jgi:hypothetical protein
LYKIKANEYVIKPGKDRKTKLQVLLEDGDSISVAKQIEYRVMHLPNPELFWGSAGNGKIGAKSARLLRAKYRPEIPLRASFVIVKWELTVNGETASGTGGNLSPAGPLINAATSGDFVIIQATVRGPDGIARKIAGTFPI